MHIAGKDNAVADMLSQARYDDEEAMIDDDEDVGSNFYSMALARREGNCLTTPLELFSEDLYEGEWLYIGKYLRALEKQEG